MGKGNRGLSYIAMLDVEIESSFPISTLKRPEDLFPLVSTHYRLIYEITHLQSDRKTCAPKHAWFLSSASFMFFAYSMHHILS